MGRYISERYEPPSLSRRFGVDPFTRAQSLKVVKSDRAHTLEEMKLAEQYEQFQETLSKDEYAPHRAKPLAFWALPSDRCLPLVLMGRKTGDLIRRSYDDIVDVPGIGRRKLEKYLMLLSRVQATTPEEIEQVSEGIGDDDDPWRGAQLRSEDPIPDGRPSEGNGQDKGPDDDANPADDANQAEPHAATNGHGADHSSTKLDPNKLSELQWSRWRACVVRHGLQNEVLGRFAPSLQDMTRGIWSTPLSDYSGSTLVQLRRRRTHGSKRIRSILEVFHSIYGLLGDAEPREHWVVKIRPRRIEQVEQWLASLRGEVAMPSKQDCRDHFVAPLMEQLRCDANEQIVALVESRLGINEEAKSVRQSARQMGLTRARVYQLLAEISEIFSVRWPEGRAQLHELLMKFDHQEPDRRKHAKVRQLRAAAELFYPAVRGEKSSTGAKESSGRKQRIPAASLTM